MIPLGFAFENRKPKARELVIISALCAIGVAGRTAFFMLPQFKPVAAIVIISGVAFGGETGFLVGAITAFVSNFFFGQGPWTPWQMFSFGIIGFLAGIMFQKAFYARQKQICACLDFLATFVDIRRNNESCVCYNVAVEYKYKYVAVIIRNGNAV